MTRSAASPVSPTLPIPRGAFIVLEGVDRCGKTTQVTRLVEILRDRGIAVEGIRFPDRTTPIGQAINAYLSNVNDLDDHVVHLLFSANRWESLASLQSKLHAGTTLICDRYAYSGVAFSAAKQGMDFSWCKQSDRGLLRPDRVLYLDINPTDAAKRGQYGAERYETQDMQRRVYANYQRLMQEEKGDSNWHSIDAGQAAESVTKALLDLVLAEVESVRQKPLQRLWLWEDAEKKDEQLSSNQ